MNSQKEHLDNLSEIRSLMERSSKFISLSGFSGILAGVYALLGALAAFWYLDFNVYYSDYEALIYTSDGSLKSDPFWFFLFDGLIILVLAIASGIILTTQKAKKNGQAIWDNSARRLLINLFIPLFAGGIFGMILILHNELHLLAPVTLMFYGLALVNASKYTLHDVKYLGLCQIGLGLIASYFVGYALLFWTIGFGVLHIIYGTVMYFKYERC